MKNLFILLASLLFISQLQAQVTINPCARATDIHIVVIGSSTAAGTGPTNSANAWVNRYRTYLQNINPNNLVTNLAVGGTTTYHIMPDWFVAPSNRPVVTPAKNVSQAITLGADAIIVNMPSNDASNGFGVNEQMFNFRTIANVADSMGIPVWVCTTQPKNFSAAKKAIQTAVRDSILNYFGSKAIDFWTGFADATDGLATFYDSGDGTHMNDTAHAELNQRVIAEGIPNIVSDTLSYTDHIVNNIYLTNTSICGDSNTMLHVVVTNLGANSAVTENLQVRYQDHVLMTTGNIGQNTINQLGACVSDTFHFAVNSANGLNQSYHAYVNQSNDADISNDSSATISLLTTGHPSIAVLNDTVMSGANAILTANTGTQDTIVWYDAPTGGSIIGYGNQYPINSVTTNQTVYPEAVRGPLHFASSLFTTWNTTTDWNGMMFDLVATDTIVVDSFRIKIHTTGLQNIVGYQRTGSLIGNEMNSSAWNLWGVDTVNAVLQGDVQTINFSDVTLHPNDTLGVYLHMQTSGSRLLYRNGAATTYSNAELKVMHGTGVTHTFGATYSPRNFSGEVFYHHGFNPKGNCTSGRVPVAAILLWPTLNSSLEKIDLQIIPNPSTGLLKFKGDNIPKIVQVSTMNGQVVREEQVKQRTIQLDGLAAGLYILSFELDRKKYRQKIMIK